MEDATPEAIERGLLTMAGTLTSPLPIECLLCFVWRMLDEFGCNATLRWSRHWRDIRAPRATALENRLARLGGFCDCEIFLNGWLLAAWLRGDDVGETPPVLVPEPLPACSGVRRGSSQPCRLWVRRPRPWPRR